MLHAIDVIFCARRCEAALSASSLAISIFGLLLWTSTGLVGASAPLIAAELGRRKHAVREVRRTVRMALWLSLLVSIAAMGICAAGGPIMIATGEAPDISAHAASFLLILMWGMFPMVAASVLRIFVSALGRPKIATAITFLALFVNALGYWALVFGHLGPPALGLHGSALSIVPTSSVMLLDSVVVIQSNRWHWHYPSSGI